MTLYDANHQYSHVYHICKVNENKLKQGPIQAILASCAGGQVIYQFMFIARDNYIVLNQLSEINMAHISVQAPASKRSIERLVIHNTAMKKVKLIRLCKLSFVSQNKHG